MNVASLGVTSDQAFEALRQYKQHRDAYDKRDWEIERIYRAISKGKTVISVNQALISAGFDERNRPKLAIGRADDTECRCVVDDNVVMFSPNGRFSQREFRIQWPGAVYKSGGWGLTAKVPRIPPQHRPASNTLKNYHILWEADWQEIPRDPYLLKRIGKDAWIVLAAWDLTDVEVSVLRAHHKISKGKGN